MSVVQADPGKFKALQEILTHHVPAMAEKLHVHVSCQCLQHLGLNGGEGVVYRPLTNTPPPLFTSCLLAERLHCRATLPVRHIQVDLKSEMTLL